jgi:large conductance mechanosensitive channel
MIFLWSDFKKFAVKGNVLDLAVGVIIGGAFGKIVSSLVGDLIMPTVGLLLGGVNFSNLSLKVQNATIRYGAFIQTVVDFLIISFSIFIFIRFISRFKKTEEEVVILVDKKEELLSEIRDILRENPRALHEKLEKEGEND